MYSKSYFEDTKDFNGEDVELSTGHIVDVKAWRSVEGYTLTDNSPLSDLPDPPEDVYTQVGEIEFEVTYCTDEDGNVVEFTKEDEAELLKILEKELEVE